jgi:hypothetical protein
MEILILFSACRIGLVCTVILKNTAFDKIIICSCFAPNAMHNLTQIVAGFCVKMSTANAQKDA